MGNTARVFTGNLAYLFGPLTAFAVVGVLMLLLRWAFSDRSTSLVARRPVAGHSGEYGLLVPVASPATFVEGELLRRRLEDAGLRATLVPTADGPRVMVFPENERVARAIIGQEPQSR
jgi:hypothetical protein